MRVTYHYAFLAAVWVAWPAAAQPVVGGGKRETPDVGVSSWKEHLGRGKTFSGVVEKIGDDSVTVRRTDRASGNSTTQDLVPVDRLKGGELLDDAQGGSTYRWEDVKVGDTVTVRATFDAEAKTTYCLSVCIQRRAGAKLPESQRPEGDAKRYHIARVFNDLENGQDVSDDDIREWFPPEFVWIDRNRPGLGKQLDRPAGLPKEYQEKLDAIRAKKEKDLKATPPDKK